MKFLPPLLVLGCTPQSASLYFDQADLPAPYSWLEDNWTEASSICNPNLAFADEELSNECVEQLITDLGVDIETFDSENAHLLIPLYGMYAILASDLGNVYELSRLSDPDDIYAIRSHFVHELTLLQELQDQTEVNALLYNIVTSTILSTTYRSDPLDDNVNASFSSATRTLSLYSNSTGTNLEWAGTLVHEAMHGWLDYSHITCPDDCSVYGHECGGMDWCDQDWARVRGFAVATYRLLCKAVPEETDNSDDAAYYQYEAEVGVQWQAGFILEP